MGNDLRRKILLSLLFALLLYMAFVLWSDWRALTTALLDFPWLWLPLVIGLTLINYVGRLLKWHWYLRLLNIPIRRVDSGRIFGVGMLMVMTPGKAGEFLKSYMVKNVAGTPMAVTAPVVMAERMTDGVAMLLLASVGLFAFPDPKARWVAAIVFANFLLTVIVIQSRPLALRILDFGKHLPVISRFADHLYSFYESSYLIFRPRNLLISLAIGVVSWVAEGIAYFVVLVGFGAQPSARTLLIAIFIFCISTVIGAVFATPGGLGGVEGSLIALSSSLLTLPTAIATAAALLVRFCTLWFGVSIGVVSFALWPALLAGSETVHQSDAAPPAPLPAGPPIPEQLES